MSITTSRPWRPALGESIALHIEEVTERRSKYGGMYPVLRAVPFDPDTGVYADHEVTVHAYHVELRRQLERLVEAVGEDIMRERGSRVFTAAELDELPDLHSLLSTGDARIRITYYGLVEKHSPKHGKYVMHGYRVESLPDREG